MQKPVTLRQHAFTTVRRNDSRPLAANYHSTSIHHSPSFMTISLAIIQQLLRPLTIIKQLLTTLTIVQRPLIPISHELTDMVLRDVAFLIATNITY